MTNELVKILEAALEEQKKSMKWFEMYIDSNDNFDWEISKEHDMKCCGLLQAYEILTGKNIRALICEIREELETAYPTPPA